MKSESCNGDAPSCFFSREDVRFEALTFNPHMVLFGAHPA